MSTQPYRPSCGTEGADFICEWCEKCQRDINQDCEIVSATFVYDKDDPEYPKEWVADEDYENPRCTAFIPLGEPVPKPRCTQTDDMFSASESGGDQ